MGEYDSQSHNPSDLVRPTADVVGTPFETPENICNPSNRENKIVFEAGKGVGGDVKIGLFGSCGDSTWRQKHFIPKLEKYALPFFNPQVDEWTPELAEVEAENMAMDKVIVIPISKETEGYASLAETGWAVLGGLLRGQRIGILIEEDPGMSEAAQRSRILVRELAKKIESDYPIFTFEDGFEDLSNWTVFQMKEAVKMSKSKMISRTEVTLPERNTGLKNMVGMFGTSGEKRPEWNKLLSARLQEAGVDFFDSFKESWTNEDAAAEVEHKANDKVVLQVITGETESYGALAESGWLTLLGFLRGQKVGLYIEEHPSGPKTPTNRARTLVKAHAERLLKDFPDLFYLAKSPEDLADFAIKQIK